ncbi:hypothetical protein BHE74_00000515 [Ensete ventricosum]|nr:hypothetical protein BHE74_00000515 [Ensete ventricosum]
MKKTVVLSTVEDLTVVDFDGDVNLAEKEVVVLSTADLAGRRIEAAATVGGRCWDGKEQLARDQIRSRSSREVGCADGSGAAEGWPQEKRSRANLARKIDGKKEAGNSAISRGRGPRLLRLPGLQGQMRVLVTGALQANHVSDGTCDMLRNLFAYD